MGTKVWISVRSPNSRTVNIALLFFLAVYSKINIDIFSKSIHFFRLAVDECFYTIFIFQTINILLPSFLHSDKVLFFG